MFMLKLLRAAVRKESQSLRSAWMRGGMEIGLNMGALSDKRRMRPRKWRKRGLTVAVWLRRPTSVVRVALEALLEVSMSFMSRDQAVYLSDGRATVRIRVL